jgi:DNA end-binding protein Ku
MPRTIWNGVISFGMVSIPIGIYPAAQEKDLGFNQLHSTCGTRIKQQRFCPLDQVVVQPEQIQRAYEYAKGQYIPVTDEDLAGLPVPTKQTIEILAFVDAAKIDPVYFDKTYYIEPEKLGKKPYALLLKAIEKKGVAALAKVAFRNKEHLCLLRDGGNKIVLETLYYADEIREGMTLSGADLEVGDRELMMAESLVDMLYEDFQPEKYTDTYREKLLELIEAKVAGKQMIQSPEAPPPSQVIDLMEALKASVEAAKSRKSS